MILRQGQSADIGLLLEGTFPYVRGGVSSWVNQMILGFPELTFAICFLGSRPEDYGDMRYPLPDNVVHLEVHYLHEQHAAPKIKARKRKPGAIKLLETLHQRLREPSLCPHQDITAPLPDIMHAFAQDGLTEADFLYGRDAWDYITQQYRDRCRDPSFVDYFWTIRIMHSPLWQLMRITDNFIPVRVYHTISTGYAGFLGALLKQRTGRPLLLSEHGIYTKERKIDLFQAEWIRDNRGVLEKDASEVAYFRDLWVRFFEALGRECYHHSNRIIALYENNRLRQIKDGAPAERTLNIANGIDLPRLELARSKRDASMPLTICLIGRVVPIKDIKTFIRSIYFVASQLPHIEAWIAGPEDEDPDYAQDCHNLVASLGLTDKVKFLGFQKIDELLPKVGVMVLSSISEALPLVILEGYAAGVPCVATDVGSCRQLIEGLEPEDRALGASGEVVGIADPQALAKAILRLLSDPAYWRRAQQAGIQRVSRYYTQELMFSRYRAIYNEALAHTDSSTQDEAT